MWTEITRPKYERKCLGYSSNLSDAEWATIEPLLPQRNRLGRPPKTEMRSIVNAMFYMVRTGCQWRQLPREFPPFTTVQHYFYAWRDSGVLERINFELLLQAREMAGREPSPSAGVIDSQSVKTTEAGGPRGFDAAKKIKGRKRHVVTDTTGLLVGAQVHAADVQDRDGAPLVIAAIHDLFPWLRHLFALIGRGGGRMLRGSCFYEDFIKTVLTINANWSATCRMVAALVAEPGEGAFPNPQAVLDYGEERMRERGKLGFRARSVIAATRRMLDDGAITVDGNGIPDRLPHDYLLGLSGVGPYAAAHCRVLLHDFSRIPIDTSVVAYLRAKYGCDPAEFAVTRSQWGPYLALGYRMARLSDKLGTSSSIVVRMRPRAEVRPAGSQIKEPLQKPSAQRS